MGKVKHLPREVEAKQRTNNDEQKKATPKTSPKRLPIYEMFRLCVSKVFHLPTWPMLKLFEGVSDSRHPGPGARGGGSARENLRSVFRS